MTFEIERRRCLLDC